MQPWIKEWEFMFRPKSPAEVHKFQYWQQIHFFLLTVFVYISDATEDSSKESSAERNADEGEEEDDEDEGVPYESLRPTLTHEALQKMMDLGLVKYVISQNGDGLHTLSGIPADKISELHGNVFLETCEKCGTYYDRDFYVMDDVASAFYEELEDNGETTIIKPPHAKQCPRCGLSHRTGRRCDKKVCRVFLSLGCFGTSASTLSHFHSFLLSCSSSFFCLFSVYT